MLLAQKASYPTVFGVSHYPLLKFRWDNPKNGQDIPKYGRVILALPGSRFTRVWLPSARFNLGLEAQFGYDLDFASDQ